MIYGVQYLRAVAAMLVVWHHVRIQLPGLHPFFEPPFGERGVDLFFVISGFIMVVATRSPQVTAMEFLRRRMMRVVPLYWLATLGVTAIALVAPALMKSTQPVPAHVLQSLLFIPHVSPSHAPELWPILVPGWTLNDEMFFYAMFALCLGVVPRRYSLWALTAILGSLVVAGWVLQPGQPIARAWTDTLLAEFLMGVWLGRAWSAERLPRLRGLGLAVVLLLGMVGLFSDPPVPRGLVQGAGACLIVWAFLNLGFDEKSAPWLEQLGDASYSIYLTHLFSLGLVRALWVRAVGDVVGLARSAGFMAVCLIAAALLGWLVFRWVEQPLLARTKYWLAPRRPASER